MRKLSLIFALCLASIAYAAQQPVNVGTSANDHTGDPARSAFIKLNANDAELYGKFPVTVPNGGTGVTTISGVLKGNGTSAFTAAAVSDLLGLFTGTCTVSVPLRGDGSCGTVPSSAVTGLAASATTDTTNAANISSGTLPAGRLPALTGDCTTTVGTVATTCTKTSGVAFAASATTDATNASNISSGTLAAARGGAGTITGALKGSGAGVVSQAACADLSNAAASCSTDATNAANISSGILAAARGGTANGFTAFSGPATSTKTFTLPNASANVLTDNAAVTVAQGGTGVGTLTAHGVLLGEGTSNVSAVAALAADNLLLGQGATSDPAAVALTNCGDSTHALAYSTSTHTFSCQNVTGSGGTPGGSTTQVQFNLSGAFAGDSGFTYVGSSTQTITLGTATVGETINATTGSGTGTTLAINGSQGAATSNGGPLNITAGAGGSTSGNGGAITVKGGTVTSGSGGGANLTGGASSGANQGATAAVTGGAGGATGTGGSATVTGGAGGSTSGTGGAVTVQGGGVTSGTGGAVTVQGGTGSGANSGGAVSVTGGTSGATGNGATATVTGGPGGSTSGNGGTATLQGGSTTSGQGGAANVTAGTSTGANNGGGITLQAGAAGSSGTGGAVSVNAGNATSGTGGSISLQAGTAGGANNAGNVTIAAGAPSATAGSSGGSISISSGAGTSTGTGAQGNNITVTAGSAGGTGANVGGSITLTAGNATGANNGGVVTLQGGNVGTGITNGYQNVAIKAGSSGSVMTPSSGSNADTASIAIIGAASSAAANNGSDVLIRGGAPGGNAGTVGGNVWLRAGGGALANSVGNINMGGYNTGTGQPNQWYTFNMLTGAFGVNGATYGSSGNLLMSQGSASPPTWTNSVSAVTTFPAIISGGTKFTTSGCSVSSTTGGAAAGIFTLGANSCTVIITINGATGATAPTGWSCQAHDRTAPTVLIGGESSSTTTTASITIPSGAGATDVISFSCTGY